MNLGKLHPDAAVEFVKANPSASFGSMSADGMRRVNGPESLRDAFAEAGGRIATKVPHTLGLGDIASFALAIVGITEDRVSAWIGEPCGCDQRREKLNRFGEWVRSVATGIVDGAKESLEAIIGSTGPS